MISDEEILRNVIGLRKITGNNQATVFETTGSPLIIKPSKKCDIPKTMKTILNKFNVVGIHDLEEGKAVLFLVDLDTGCGFEVEVFGDCIVAHFHQMPSGKFKNEDYIQTVRNFIKNVKKHIDPEPKIYFESGVKG